MIKELDLMVFDFDGTLISSGDDLAAAVNHTLRTLGMVVLGKDLITGYIGDGVKKLIERSLGDAYPHKFDEALTIFMSFYSEHLLDTTDLYPGVKDMLDWFKNKKKAIVTNKNYSYTLTIAAQLHIKEYFDDIIGADSSEYKKPDPRLLRPLMERYGAEPQRTVVVGDGDNDILLAKNAGVLSCALLNGLGSRKKLLSLNPDYVCESITELKTLFR
jgi:phosphoglycolate phosphatase